MDSKRSNKPQRDVITDLEPLTVPGLPDQIQMTNLQLPNFIRDATDNVIAKILDQALQVELKSYGVIVNSFHELEPAYSEHYRRVMGRKAWHVGPVSLSNRRANYKTQTENTAPIDGQEYLRWLDSKKPNLVLYVCFGSMYKFSALQLLEIAKGLEAYGQHFISVCMNGEDKEDWMPEGFKERIQGKGFIKKGWAPKIQILEHEDVGRFLTHCEWSSILEGVAAGVPMATWPLYGEQFFNEKLIIDVLRTGVGVGSQEWARWIDENKFIVKGNDISKAVTELMIGEEANNMRSKAKELGEMERRAVEEGGSSSTNLNALLADLRSNCP